MATTTYEAISPRTKVHAKARLLQNAKARMIIEQFGEIDPIPRNASKTAVWRRYLPFPLAVAPLAEGVTPSGFELQYEDVSASLEQYGGWCPVTDIVQDTHEDRVLNGVIVPNLSTNARETIETIRWNRIRSGSYATYSGGTGRTSVNGTMTRPIQSAVVRLLKRNRAQQVTKVMRASANIATDPIMPAFIGLTHTDMEPDLRAMPETIDVAHYAQNGQLVGEHCKNGEVRYCTSDLFKPWLQAATSTSVTTWLSNGDAPTSAANPDVYAVLIFGEMAYHIVPFAGNNAVNMYVVNPTATVADPIAQKGFASYKTLQAAAITTQAWMHRVEAAASASPSA